MTDIMIITMQNGPLEENCYLIYSQKTKVGIIVDPGSEAERLIKAIKDQGVRPKLIVASHGHFDHIGAVEALKTAFNIPFAAMKLEEPVLAMAQSYGSMFGMPEARQPKVDRYLTDGESLVVDDLELKVLHTPGHSPGSVCLYHESSANLFSGDTLFEESVGRQDLPGGDPGAMKASVMRLYQLPDAVQVWPGHGSTTTLGHEKRHNPYIRL
jgi:hydroxyacylglutathione hydrolase